MNDAVKVDGSVLKGPRTTVSHLFEAINREVADVD